MEPTLLLVGGGTGLAALGVVSGVAIERHAGDDDTPVEADLDLVDLAAEAGDREPPEDDAGRWLGYVEPPVVADTSSSVPGLALARAYKHYLRRRRLARKGYVAWVRVVNGVRQEPTYIKPERWVGSPYPIYRADGEKYYFPAEAAVLDERSGMRTFVHRDGEAEPVNLHDGEAEVLNAKDLAEAEEMEVATAPPSLLERLDVDLGAQEMVAIGIALLLVITAIGGVLQ